MSPPLVLASGSRHRLRLLQDAGVAVEAVPSALDERMMEAPLAQSGVTPDEVAAILAEAKANDVSERRPDALVIGADQTLALGDRRFHKPEDMDEARRTLLALSGRTHELHSAVALVRDGDTVWSHVATARVTFRELTPPEIGRYLAQAGEAVLGSVGAYQVEGLGVRLMSRIEGDLFTIVGLPLVPLLAALRDRGALDEF